MSRLERKRRRDRRNGGAAKIFLLSFGVISALFAIAGLLAVGYIVSIADSAPDISQLKPVDEGSNTIIYAADGTKLGVIPALILRDPIVSSEIPQSMKNATVAIEDQRFYHHKGVDIEGIVRAAFKNIQSHGDKIQGGSTLTMQLIKNLYPADIKKRGLKRKIREAKMAEQLEQIHPGRAGKNWILTKYVNSVFYGAVGGQNAYGVQAAARVFFNKPAHDLTIAETALLAGLPQAPSQYNPYVDKAAALTRRNEVLGKEHDLGYITDAQYATAIATPIQLHPSSYYRTRRESYFFDYVKGELIKKYGRKKVLQGGLRVTTTIDFNMQRKARAAITKNLGQPGDPSAALVSIDPKNGHIRAMASSSSYANSKFNLATQAERQPGSTFKMIVLMTGLRRGVDINATSYVSKKLKFFDQPTGTEIDVNTDDGTPSNAPKSLFNAVVTSDNTVFQQFDLDLGPRNVTKTARDMGITSELDSFPAEGLGGPRNCCTPLEMTRAYVSMNDGGYRIKPVAITKVVFPDGKVDTSLAQPQRVKIFTDGQAYEAIQAMKANVAGGTGTAANIGFCPTAGKTGTTSGFKDAWFNGMTTNLNTAVWVGFAQPREMVSVPGWPGEMFGGTAPATIFHDFMSSAIDKKSCHDWPQPTVPFVAQPFVGRIQSKHGQGTGAYTPANLAPATTTKKKTGKKKGTGPTKFPPTQYQTPPATTTGGTTTGGTTTGGTNTPPPTTTGDTTTGTGGGNPGGVVPIP